MRIPNLVGVAAVTLLFFFFFVEHEIKKDEEKSVLLGRKNFCLGQKTGGGALKKNPARREERGGKLLHLNLGCFISVRLLLSPSFFVLVLEGGGKKGGFKGRKRKTTEGEKSSFE